MGEPSELPDLRRRLLFCSLHCLLDPSSGAAIATRDLLQALAGWGWDCRALCGPQLDYEQPESLPQVISDLRLTAEVRQRLVGAVPVSLFQLHLGQVPVSVYDGGPNPREESAAEVFLALADRLFERFQPHVLLTYGGDAATGALMARAQQRGIRVVFALHNFAYNDASLFHSASAVLVPSRFAREHYRHRLGLSCTALPHPLDWTRFYDPPSPGRYVTFVNPQPVKGVFWFARLAAELGRQRPDIPLLVVEGRGGAGWLARTGVNLSNLTNLHVLASSPDPRDFYRVSRLMLMPSLWDESFGLVATEALANGIPVLASDRGALPEVLTQAGLLFHIPPQYMPATAQAPSADEVAPWVQTVTRLWDDPTHYEQERQRCLQAAEAWRPERLRPAYEAFFASLAGST